MPSPISQRTPRLHDSPLISSPKDTRGASLDAPPSSGSGGHSGEANDDLFGAKRNSKSDARSKRTPLLAATAHPNISHRQSTDIAHSDPQGSSSSSKARNPTLGLTFPRTRQAQTPAEAYAFAHQHSHHNQQHAAAPRSSQTQSRAGGVEEWLRYRHVSDSGHAREPTGSADNGKKRDRDGNRDKESNMGTMGSKPLFDWITRKLGGGKRSSLADIAARDARTTAAATVARGKAIKTGRDDRIASVHRGNPTISIGPAPPSTPPRTRIGPAATYSHRPKLSPAQIFPHIRDRGSTISRSETHSLRSYSLASPSERERRREANNPYPSIPIPLHRGSLMSSDAPSLSFISRSRSPSVRSIRSAPSMRSERSGRSARSGGTTSMVSFGMGGRSKSISSSLRPRMSILERRRKERATVRRIMAQTGTPDEGAEDGEGEDDGEGDGDDDDDERDGSSSRMGLFFADEDASIRPCPPSHPGSPTPSIGMQSRTSCSASDMLSFSAPLGGPSIDGLVSDDGPLHPPSLWSSDVRRSGSPAGESHCTASGETDGDYESSFGGRSRQGSASTKPTTVRSFDSNQSPAHIAQVQPSPQSPQSPASDRDGVASGSNNVGSITPPRLNLAHANGVFAAGMLPSASSSYGHGIYIPTGAAGVASPLREAVSATTSASVSPTSTTPPSLASPTSSPGGAFINGTASRNNPDPSSPTAPGPPVRLHAPDHNDEPIQPTHTSRTQAPKHTPHHPIYNPHPSSPPDPNASTLTLASSNFARPSSVRTQSIHRPTSVSRLSIISTGPSVSGPSGMRRDSAGQILDAVGESDGNSGEPNARAGGGSFSVTWAPDPATLAPPIQLDESTRGRRGSGDDDQIAPNVPVADTALLSPLKQPSNRPRPTSFALSSRLISTAPHASTAEHQSTSQTIVRNPRETTSTPPVPMGGVGPSSGVPPPPRPVSMLSASIRSTGGSGPIAVWRPALSGHGPGSISSSAHGFGYGYGYGYGGADEGASVRALRRRGSAGSVDSFESRWSWMGAGGPGSVHTPGANVGTGTPGLGTVAGV